MNRDPGLGNHARPAAEMKPYRAMDNKRMTEKHVASLARRERASSLERGGGKSVSHRRKRHSALAERRDTRGTSRCEPMMISVGASRSLTSEERNNAKAPVGRTIQRDIRLAVAVEIADHRDVTRETPHVRAIRRVVRARPQEVPAAIGGPVDGRVHLPIAVIIGRDRHVAAEAPKVADQ